MNPIYFWAFQNIDARFFIVLIGVVIVFLVVGVILETREEISKLDKESDK